MSPECVKCELSKPKRRKTKDADGVQLCLFDDDSLKIKEEYVNGNFNEAADENHNESV